MLSEDDMRRIRAKSQSAHEEIQDIYDGWRDALNPETIDALYAARTAIEALQKNLGALAPIKDGQTFRLSPDAAPLLLTDGGEWSGKLVMSTTEMDARIDAAASQMVIDGVRRMEATNPGTEIVGLDKVLPTLPVLVNPLTHNGAPVTFKGEHVMVERTPEDVLRNEAWRPTETLAERHERLCGRPHPIIDMLRRKP